MAYQQMQQESCVYRTFVYMCMYIWKREIEIAFVAFRASEILFASARTFK